PNTLSLVHNRKPAVDPAVDKSLRLEDEIALEVQLKAALRASWARKGTSSYTTTMGKWVLEELYTELATKRGVVVSPEDRKEALSVLSTPKEKLKLSSTRVANLRSLIMEN